MPCRCWATPTPTPTATPNPNSLPKPNPDPDPYPNQVLPLLGAPTVVEAGHEISVQFTMALDDDIGVPPAYEIAATVS